MVLNITDAFAWLVTMSTYILIEGATLTRKIPLQELNFLSILLLQWDKKFLSHILLQNNHIFSVVSKTVL